MSSSYLRSSFYAVVCSCAAVTVNAAPAATNDEAGTSLLATINSVTDMVIGQPASAIQAKLPEIQKKMEESFATKVIVQRTFGRNWSKLTPAQQTEVIDLLGRLVIRAYATQLSKGSRPVITVTGTQDLGSDRREVTTTATQDGKTVNIVYRLGKIDGGWKVYDVLAEGISVVANYREQFDAHFQTKNAADLIEILKGKLAAPEEAKPATDASGKK